MKDTEIHRKPKTLPEQRGKMSVHNIYLEFVICKAEYAVIANYLMKEWLNT